MIRIFGELSLWIAMFFALLQSIVPLWGCWKRNPFAVACARPAILGQFFCVLLAYLLLTTAFISNDFSISYVAANSHSTLPLMYRATAVWGAHEGSILLWILILAIWSLTFSLSTAETSHRYFKPLVLAILGLISICFLAFLLFTSNPFVAAHHWQTAQDLNPLLQDPGFIIHPPMLYMGYVGFSTAFAITIASLLQGTLDRHWIRIAKQYAIAAWCFLTFGIMLGSWWAYRVLGWGGFWFWDPVENASLLPWLAGTALIHVLLLVEKRGIATSWAALLAIISFSLSLLGTFLVRSGVLISAHTFASDPSRGVFLLLLLALVFVGALLIYLLRVPATSSPSVTFPLLSRETSLLVNSALLMIAMATILLGTLYPLIVDALHLGSVSVGAPYFNLVMLPLLFILMTAMGAGVLCHWQGQTWRTWWRTARKNALISLGAAVALIWCFTTQLAFVPVACLALSFWIILSILPVIRTQPGMSLAHLGFAVLVIGIILSSTLNQEREIRVKPGNIELIGPYQFLFIDTAGISSSNYRGIRAEFEVLKNSHHVTSLYPEKRIYTVRDMVMTKVDINPGIFRDLYIALGEPLDDNYWSVRIYYKPFIRWIWFGGILMIVGGIIAIMTRRKTP
jgi:cytochrome c-type biogenesis protein CcmF